MKHLYTPINFIKSLIISLLLFVSLNNECIAQACNTPYVAGTVYVGGATVSHNGRNFTAKYWTQNEAPNPANQWGAWTDNGACASCSLLPGTIGTSQSIPSNTIPNPLTNVTSATVTNGGTILYQWQKSTNNSTWTDIAGATSSVYSPGTITSKTFFRRKVSVSGCTEAYSPSVVISISVNNNLDTDGDGKLDSVDLDDDNDGILDCVENGFEQVNLSNVFNIAGTANYVNTNEILLTPNLNAQAGSAMSFGKIDFNKDFNFNVEVFLGINDGGADGMAIVFHNDPNGVNAVGISGSGLGAQSIKNGVSIEFDTYNNGEMAEDHTHMKLTQTWGDLTTMKALPNIEDGQWHLVNFNWNAASQTLNYSFDGNLMASYTNDLVTNVFNNESNVYFGFTASTGGAINEQKIRIPDSFCSYPIFKDTDNDGIVNSLDTDSDGDGCADAIEGGASFTPTNLTSNRLSGGVDANGIPVIATSSGQTIGTSDNANSKDVVCSLCTSDNDNDGVCDVDDLDDDNDGILDNVECEDKSASWDFETPVVGAGNNFVGTTFQGWTCTGGGTINLIRPPYGGGVPQTASVGKQYVEVAGTGDFSRVYTVTTAGVVTVEIDFACWGGVTEQTQINIFKADGTTLVAQSPIISTPQPVDWNNAWLHKGTVSVNLTPGDYVIKFFLGNFQAFDNVRISSATVANCDTDSDGIINSFDTDSDGDGCADAIEGGAAFKNTDLSGLVLAGNVDAKGVPIKAGASGQTVGSSADKNVKDVECVVCNTPAPVVNGASSDVFHSFDFNSTQALNEQTPVLENGKKYKLKVTGTWSVWSNDPSKKCLDAAFKFADDVTGNAFGSPFSYGYIKLDGNTFPRPDTNVYKSNHEYWYTIIGQGNFLNITYADNGPYSDNNGILKFTFYAPIDTIKVCASTSTTSLGQYVTGTNLLWYTAQTGGVGSSTVPVVNNSNAQLYTYWVSQTVNGCESDRAPLYFKVLSKPTVVANGGSICIGSSKTLTASGATTYTWSPSTNLSATTGASVTANPSITTVYTVSITDAKGCVGADTALVTVNALPTVVANGISICTGSSKAITATGATTFTWSPSTNLSATTGASVTANPNITTVYTVEGTDVNGCVGTDTAKVTVNALPTVSLGKDTILCQGSNITLNAGVANTYKWNDNSIAQTLQVTSAGLYKVTVTNSNNCSAADSINVLFKNCNNDLIVEDSIAICKGSSLTINAKNVKSTLWKSSEPFTKVNDSTITATPTTTAKYYVTSYTKKSNSLVNGDFELPNIGSGFSVLDASNVAGWKTTATDNAIEIWYKDMGVAPFLGNQFIELNANMVAALYQDIPTIPGTKLYWEFAHRGRSGVESMDFSIGGPSGPYVKIGTYDDGTDKWGHYSGIYEVPSGQTTTRFYFTSNGGGSMGNFLDAISFYTLDEQKDSVLVKLNSLPTLNLGKDTILCQGENISLNAGTASSYQWNDNSTLQTLEVSSAGLYKVTVTNENNCKAADSINVLYKKCNTDLIIEDSLSICKGDSIIIKAHGVTNETWSGTEGFTKINDSTIIVKPNGPTAVYKISSLAGYTKGQNVIVNGDFESGDVGFTTQYSKYTSGMMAQGAYAVGNSAQNYNGGFASCGDNTTGTGKMFVTDGATTANVKIWCQTVSTLANTKYEFATFVTSVYDPNPPILQFQVNGNLLGNVFQVEGTLCNWQKFAATWNSNTTTSAEICIVNQNTAGSGNDFVIDDIEFVPIYPTSTYADSVVVIVNALPNVIANGGSICTGESKTLTATGASTYSWSPSTNLSATTGASVSANPTNTIVYTVTGTDANGCKATDTAKVTVNTLPTVVLNGASICNGDSLLLTATGASTYSWTPNTNLSATTGTSV
ncbi:MAG: hypothetical protein RLZZ175_3179, partial [Bacteroidota bacterium]